MKKWAQLICSEYNPGSITDDAVLVPLFKDKGVELHDVIWDRETNWDQFERVLVRSPWDYVEKYDNFIKTLNSIADSRAEMDNSFETMKYNSVKTYLGDLEKQGVEIIPTHFFKPIDGIQDELRGFAKQFERFIIKPTIGASSSGLQIFDNVESLETAIFENNEIVYMCQPLIKSITEIGEYSLIFFDGEFSHAILKTPKKGEIRCQDEFGSHIREVEVSSDIISWGNKIIKLQKEMPLYARVDFLLNEEDQPRLMELELIEPCLFFSKAPSAAGNFIKACERRGYF